MWLRDTCMQCFQRAYIHYNFIINKLCKSLHNTFFLLLLGKYDSYIITFVVSNVSLIWKNYTTKDTKET